MIKTYSMTHKNKIAIALLRWLRGWAKLADGLLTIFTLGNYDPDLTTYITENILMRMISNDNYTYS